ncbi:hypothetical protein BJ165DRAFT_1409910 [Panaeolus papilionaceus]|nr:hypothetical protein BJ165DRAFT_1409910 [Panaeolus papilionaceus]
MDTTTHGSLNFEDGAGINAVEVDNEHSTSRDLPGPSCNTETPLQSQDGTLLLNSTKRLRSDLKCVKNEVKCLERSFEAVLGREGDLHRLVLDLGNQAAVNDHNNDILQDMLVEFKAEVMGRLDDLERHIEILELVVDSEEGLP